jgi:gluconolactonase
VIKWLLGGFAVLLTVSNTSFDPAERGDAGMTVLNSRSYYPEGPIQHRLGLLYAEMRRDRIMLWDGDRKQEYWVRQGCGPTSIARWQQDGLIILCHLEGSIVAIDSQKRPLFTIAENSRGARLVHPNDSINDGHGGVFFTDSGVFHPEAPSTGKIYYLSPEADISLRATGLSYANGIALLDSKTLLVSEHRARRVLAYDISRPGVLSGNRIFYELGDLPVRSIQFPDSLTGPDGIDVDGDGNVYICEYGTGFVHIVSAEGALITRLQTGLPLLTNIALSSDASHLRLTGSYVTSDPRAGKVIVMRNPLSELDD